MSLPPPTDPPSQPAPDAPPPAVPPTETIRPPQDGPSMAGPAAVPKCAFCGGGPDGEPPDDVMERAREARRNRPLSEKERARLALELGRQEQRRRGFLGPLLGPLSEKVGLAGVWVHRECAIWSPEVYFADSGHLKNVAAAVRRGRLLRCVFCQRGGPTMGCWIERCPKSYHLACARADGCHFNHADYLITCHDHAVMVRRPKRHRLAQNGPPEPHKRARPWPLPVPEPQPEIAPPEHGKRARRAAAVAAVQRISITARQDAEREAARGGDLAADEAEFLKRERRRLQRDIARIAPLRLGGAEPGADMGGPPGWESVAGLRHVVDCLKEMVVFPLLYPAAFARLGEGPPRGVLLHGHPGTGKTLVARALAGACSRGPHQVAFFARKGADCLGKYVGDAERQLRLLFQVAAASAPSIIFFDEMDGLAPARQVTASDQTHASVVATLLALLDGATPRGAVVVIAATNRPDAIDAALRRPGRFDREIYFPLPSLPDRAAILGVHTAAWPSPPPPTTLRALAKATPGYAGADLAALAAQAALVALKRSLGGRIPEPPATAPLSPAVHVTANDWARALAAAPSPASRRSCQALLAVPPSTPLPPPLVPLLGPPLAGLLLALRQDGRAVLPPTACSAAGAVAAALADVSNPSSSATPADAALWGWASAAERAAVGALLKAGVLSGPGSEEPGNDADWNADEKESHGNGGGVRVLVTGTGAVGQEALVGALVALLEGGDGEVHSASLGAMLMAGHGDPVQGLSRILSDVRGRRAAILVMPRLESWATVQVPPPEGDEGPAVSVASAAWKMFLQQICGAPNAAPALILATAGMPTTSLPTSVASFFGGHSSINTEAMHTSERTPSATTPKLVKGATWQLAKGASGGAVGCFRVALVGGDPPREAAMFRWAAHSSAAAVAHSFLRKEKALRSSAEEEGQAAGERKRKREPSVGVVAEEKGNGDTEGVQNNGITQDTGVAGAPDDFPTVGPETETGLPSSNVDSDGMGGNLAEGDPPPNANITSVPINPTEGDSPPQKRVRLSSPGGEPAVENGGGGPTATALRWCGRQLLSAPQWGCLRRASAIVTWEKEARKRPLDVARAASSSPAPAAGTQAPPLRDATPPPPSGGLVGVARTALSDGFSSAAELSAAVGRVLARVRRREENERSKRRRLEMGGDAEQEGYPPVLAAAAALQDTVAGWEYALGKTQAAAGKGRLPGLEALPKTGAAREDERRREESVQARDPGYESEARRKGGTVAGRTLAHAEERGGQDAAKGGERSEPGGNKAGVAAGGEDAADGQDGMEAKGMEKLEGEMEQRGGPERERNVERKREGTEGSMAETSDGLLQPPAGGSEAVVGGGEAEPTKVHRGAVQQEAGSAASTVKEQTGTRVEGSGTDKNVDEAGVSLGSTGAETEAEKKERTELETEHRQESRGRGKDGCGATTRSDLWQGERKRATGVETGGWWAPECFSHLAEAILERYTNESERHETVAEAKVPEGSVSADLQSAKVDTESSGVEVDRILEVVAASNRRVQACLAGIGTEGKDTLCTFCQKHYEKRQEGWREEDGEKPDLRPICLGPLSDALRQLSAEVQK